MKNSYTVYMHIFPNNKIYIGMTKMKPKERWHSGLGYHKGQILMYNAIKKYGWENVEHQILYENLTKEEAEQKEIELIAQYKSNKNEYGYNIANGGNGSHTVSDATKQKLKIKNGGKNNYWYGKHLSQEHKSKIIKTKKGKRYGGAISLMKKVRQLDLNHNFICEFNCIKDAGRYTNIPYQNISMCCRKIIKKTHNYIFEFVDNQEQ